MMNIIQCVALDTEQWPFLRRIAESVRVSWAHLKLDPQGLDVVLEALDLAGLALSRAVVPVNALLLPLEELRPMRPPDLHTAHRPRTNRTNNTLTDTSTPPHHSPTSYCHRDWLAVQPMLSHKSSSHRQWW